MRLVALLATALFALAVVGCGGSGNSNNESSSSGSGASAGSGSGSTTAPGADKQIADSVPQAIKSKGSISVAADATYAPNEFIGKDGKTVEGMDVDLIKALAGVMGLKANVQNANFDGIIPGLASGKYDVGMSSFTDTKEREKTVDFVTYFSAGTSFYVKAQGGPTINSLSDLCGHHIAVEKGTTQQIDSTKQAKKCGGNTTVSTFPDQNGANLALSSGRADVGMADSPVAAYQVKQSNGQFKLTGQPYGTAPYGIALPKGAGMDKPMLEALKKLISDGTYMKILKKWGVQEGAIDNPVINGAQS
jgi:polar amino acid transport system substrate-binding protein